MRRRIELLRALARRQPDPERPQQPSDLIAERPLRPHQLIARPVVCGSFFLTD
jgi:hypothetical protein